MKVQTHRGNPQGELDLMMIRYTKGGKTAPKLKRAPDGDIEISCELSRFIFETIGDFNWLCAGNSRQWQEGYIRQLAKQRATMPRAMSEIHQAHAVYLNTELDLNETLKFVDAQIARKGLRGDSELALYEKHVWPILHKQKDALAQVIEAAPTCAMDIVLKFHVLPKEDFNVSPMPATKITAQIDDFLVQNGA